MGSCHVIQCGEDDTFVSEGEDMVYTGHYKLHIQTLNLCFLLSTCCFFCHSSTKWRRKCFHSCVSVSHREGSPQYRAPAPPICIGPQFPRHVKTYSGWISLHSRVTPSGNRTRASDSKSNTILSGLTGHLLVRLRI